MKKTPKYTQQKPKRRVSKTMIVMGCVAGVLLVLFVALLLWAQLNGQELPEKTEPTTEPVETTAETTEATTEATTEPEETEPTMVPELEEYYTENPDICGWLRISDTVIDYPVMYTPEDPEKYLRKDFDGSFSVAGELFVDGNCSLDPESDNLIIYGHNMNNGSMFRTLMKYEEKTFWEQHPLIELDTLYEKRTYEVVSAFYDRVYYSYEDCFKFYQFIDAEDEAAYEDAVTYYKGHDLYDTGVTPEYGDRLLTLVTCAYHTDYGRFVVVAREVTE